jgi:hypothetical protein
LQLITTIPYKLQKKISERKFFLYTKKKVSVAELVEAQELFHFDRLDKLTGAQLSVRYNLKILFMRYLAFFFGILFFSGCASAPQNTPEKNSPSNSTVPEISENHEESILKNLVIQEQENAKKIAAGLEIQKISEDEKSLVVQVILHNPNQEKIQSIQSWITYPEKILTGEKISLLSSDIFDLVAPGEQNFDVEKGLVKIGISVGGKAERTNTQLAIAQIEFEKKSDSPFLLEFFDISQTGHTRVMSMTQTGVRNILNPEKITVFEE